MNCVYRLRISTATEKPVGTGRRPTMAAPAQTVAEKSASLTGLCYWLLLLVFVVVLFVEIPVEEAADRFDRLTGVGPRCLHHQMRARLGGERQHL